MTSIAILAAILAATSLFRERISTWPLTAPMIFVAAGILLGPDITGVLKIDLDDESLVLAAEITLAMLLFSDAARIDTATLRRSFSLPGRLLAIGLPISVAAGAAVTGLLLVDLSWSEAALVGAILAPTDAALGEAVVSNTAVPVRIRQALNVESGLNDGLVVPIVAIFSALAIGHEVEAGTTLVAEAATEVLLGLAIGSAIGIAMGLVVPWLKANDWTDAEGLRLLALGGALAGFAFASAVGGNGFITAFVCGLAVRLALGERAGHHTSLAEDIGQIGASALFVVFGAVMVFPALETLSWPVAVCTIGTLTVGRIVPVAIATTGAGLKAPTRLFLGWFGPRGLASMLFGLLLLAERGPEVDQLFQIITVVILASVFLHGATAAVGAEQYSRWFGRYGKHELAESEPAPETRIRWKR